MVKDVITDADGSTHVRYDRTFDGLRVIGGDLVSHRDKAGAVKSVTWNASRSATVASKIAKVGLVSAKAAGAKKASSAQKTTTANTGELVVYAGGATPKLSYDVVSEGVRADQTPSRLHGTNYVNAFWDGTQMTYGDGAGNGNPLVELGTAVEFYANNASDTPDYLIGEEININGNGTPLRYMDQPSKDGASRDCWSSTLASLDPHYSSGPLNHWFYLASEGSGAKVINGVSYNSPTCNASTVIPIGRAAAEKIWYRTLSTYLTSSSNYAAARTGAVKAAKDLYGVGSAQCAGIIASFAAISAPVGTETCGTTPPPTGNLLLNPGFESGAVNWTGSAGRPAYAGTWKMWLGGNGVTTTETESQTVTIPSAAAAPALSYWISTDTAESGSTAYDTMKVQVVSGATTTTLVTYSNVGTNATYAQKSFSLAAYKGLTITVKFLMVEDSSLQTSFVVDDTAVTTG